VSALPYLRGYAPELLARAQKLITEGQLLSSVLRRYPQSHAVRSDRALFDYASALKTEHLRTAEPLSKVAYDNKTARTAKRARHARWSLTCGCG
jgi:UTP pyrophosphatase